MSGAIPLLPYMPSWRIQGHLYLDHFTIVTHILTLLLLEKLLGVGGLVVHALCILNNTVSTSELLSAELYV